MRIIVDRDCAGTKQSDRPPALIGSDAYYPDRPLKRLPRLCARIGKDGHVLAARILRSSGRLATDRKLEAQARQLLFKPAVRDALATPATVTLDVVGSNGPPPAAYPAATLAPQIAPL